MIRYFLFFLLLSSTAFAQKRPTQAEINKLKQQMQEQLKQMEKEDPEAAKLMKQMMGQAQGQTGDKQEDNKPKAEKDFIQKIPLKGPVTPPSEAQAKDRLFWYKGKKIDPFTLITTSGTLVQYQPSKKRLVVQTDPKKDRFSNVLSELKRSAKRKDDFIERMDKSENPYFIYPFVQQGLDGFDEAEKMTAQSLANTIELPPLPPQPKPTEKGSEKNQAAAPPWIIAYHDQVMQFIKAHQNDEVFSVPPPPQHDFDYCLACDSVRQKKEAAADSLYREEFTKEERAISEKIWKVIGAWQQANEPKEWEPLANDMFDANLFLEDYLSKKCDALMAKYKNDFKALPVIISIVLALEREKELMGIQGERTTSRLSQVADLLLQSDAYVYQQMKDKNFGELLNYNWIVGLERTKQLLGVTDAEPMGRIFDTVIRFNRFKLTIDAEVKVVTSRDDDGNIKDWVMAHLSGSEFFSFFPDTLCRLRLVNNRRSTLSSGEIDAGKAYELTQFHLTVKDAQSSTGSFVGPQDWITVQPVFTASFCHELDTMILHGFSPYSSFESILAVKPNSEKWNFPKDGVQETGMISGALSKAFQEHDLEQSVGEPDANAVMKALTAGFAENNTLNDMKLRSNLMQMEMGAFTAQHTGGLYLTGTMKNNTTLVFESKLDGRENNPEVKDVLLAKLTVTLEHIPFQ